MSEATIKSFNENVEADAKTRREFYGFMKFYAEKAASTVTDKDKYAFIDINQCMEAAALELEDEIINRGKTFSEESSYITKLLSLMDKEVAEIDDFLSDFTEVDNLPRQTQLKASVNKLVEKVCLEVNVADSPADVSIEIYDRARCLGRVEASGVTNSLALNLDAGKPDVFASFSLITARINVDYGDKKEIYYLRGEYSRQIAYQKGAMVRMDVLVVDTESKQYAIQEISSAEKEQVLELLTTVM